MSDLTGLARDEEGYLIEPEDWTPELARALAREESLQLGADHWTILRFIRGY
ncbi:MAG: hypothetical protein [Olavius algarvensis Gamma 3 endosymbiont]|nr:MAG: hypothetical protein [Olavius algarvensis Gamma 3 endosymbiont]